MTSDRKPLRTFRVEDDIWAAAQERAKAEGTSVSAIIRAALIRYGKKKPKGNGR